MAAQATARRIAGFLLGLAGGVMVFTLAVFLLTAAGIWWVGNTQTGQAWLSRQASTLASGSGIAFRIQDIHAIGAGKIGIGRLLLSKDGEPYMDIAHLRVAPSLAHLLHGRGQIDLAADRVAVYDTAAGAAPDGQATAPVPDAGTLRDMAAQLPLDSLRASLRIASLVFIDAAGHASEPVAPALQAALRRDGDALHLTVAARLSDSEGSASEAALDALALLRDDAPALLIENLRLQAAGYDQTITGRIALPHASGAAEKMPLHLQTAIAEETAQLDALWSQAPDMLAIDDLRLSGPGLSGEGALRLPLGDSTASGSLAVKLDPQKLAALAPEAENLPLRETLDLTLSFEGPALTLAVPRLAVDGVDLRDISLVTAPLDGSGDGGRRIDFSARENASAAALSLRCDLHMPDSGWQARNIDATLKIDGAGSIGLSGDAAMAQFDLAAKTQSLRLDRLKGLLAAASAPARIDAATLTLTGTGAAPVIGTEGRVTPLDLPRGAPALAAAIEGRIENGMATLEAELRGKALKTGMVALRHPVTLTFAPFAFSLPQKGLDGQLRFSGDLAAFAGLLPPDLTAGGPFDVEAVLGGGLSTPTASGTAQWRGGRLAEKSSGIALRDIDARATFSEDRVTLERLTARDGRRGRLAAEGRLTLAPASWPVDVSVKITDLAPFTPAGSARPLVAGLFDADLKLKGARNDYLLQGKIGTDRLAITLPDRFGSSVPQLNIVEKRKSAGNGLPGADALKLDIALSAPQEVFVRGWGLDAEFGGTLDIGGTAAAPLVTGTLQSLRGRYEEFGRRFELSRARLDFRGEVPPSPYFDVVATTQVEDIEAQVVIGGNSDQPKITFASIPALPQEDVLARILFGRERADISPTQALQLAQTLQRFSGRGGGLDPLGALRSSIGLDDLSVDTSAEGGASVGAGKYIAEDVYLEVDSGAAGKGGAAKVKVELTPNVKIESKVGQDSTAGGGIFWEWEY